MEKFREVLLFYFIITRKPGAIHIIYAIIHFSLLTFLTYFFKDSKKLEFEEKDLNFLNYNNF